MNRTFDIIVTHERTDFDALASLLGAALLFPEAYPVLPRQMNRNVREFLALYHNHFRFVSADDLPRGRVARTFVVDARTANSPRGHAARHRIHHYRPSYRLPRGEAGEPRKLPANTRELWCGDTGANTTCWSRSSSSTASWCRRWRRRCWRWASMKTPATSPTPRPRIAMPPHWPGCSTRSVV